MKIRICLTGVAKFLIIKMKNGLYTLIMAPSPSKGFGLYDPTPYSKQNLFSSFNYVSKPLFVFLMLFDII